MAVWEEKVKSRIRSGITRYSRIFEEARRSRRKEADVGNMIYVMLEDVFGYDKITDITAEFRVRGQYADYAVRLGSKLKVFVEVKGPNVRLNPVHLLQVTTYAVKEGVEWVVLTTGLDWQLYHISKAMPIDEQLVFSCSLTDQSRADTASMLFILTKEAMQRDVAKEYWDRKQAVSAPNLLRVLYSEPIVEKMCKELRALTGHRPSTDELRRLLEAEIVRPDYAGQAKKVARRAGTRRIRARQADRPVDAEAPPDPIPATAVSRLGPDGGPGSSLEPPFQQPPPAV